MEPWSRQRLIFPGVLFAIFLLEISSVLHLSVTTDEPDHYRYGAQILRGDAERFDDSKMPFSVLNALPWRALELSGLDGAVERILARQGMRERGPLAEFFVEAWVGRIATILFSLFVAALVHRWSLALYGPKASRLSLLLYGLCPNLLAHGQLTTSDLYAAGMCVLVGYRFWRLFKDPTWREAGLFGFVLGLAQLAKYTCVYLYPALGILLLLRWMGQAGLIRARPSRALLRGIRRPLGMGGFILVIHLFVLNAGFLFHRSFTPLEGYAFKGDLFRSIQARAGMLSKIPIPLPYPYLQGLDWVKHNERTGESFGSIYLLGQRQEPGPSLKGFKGYYLVAFLFKVPLATQILLLLALARYVRGQRHGRFWQDEGFLLAPVAFFAIYFSLFYRGQMGIRFFLVVFPFLHVFVGSVWAPSREETDRPEPDLSSIPPRRRFDRMVVGLLAWQVLSVLSYFPHFLPYFNELVWDRKMAYRILADSNVDWGQGYWHVNAYMASHPDAIRDPKGPVAGRIVVRVNDLVGIQDPERFRWLRENFEPVGHVAYCFLVFEVSEEDLKGLKRDG